MEGMDASAPANSTLMAVSVLDEGESRPLAVLEEMNAPRSEALSVSAAVEQDLARDDFTKDTEKEEVYEDVEEEVEVDVAATDPGL